MAFMELQIHKGDGWIIETDDGSVVAPDIDAPDADRLRGMIGKKVQVGDLYARLESVTYVKGYFGRYSAPGYLDATPWEFDKNRKRLEKTLRDLYGDGENPGKRRRRSRRNARPQPKRTARGRRAGVRKNPSRSPRGMTLTKPIAAESFKVSKLGGWVEQMKYQDKNDRKFYVHDFGDLQALMYLAESPFFGHCIVIASADDKPLWENA